jgi:hybrid cluster-associated redox disulfide protein
MTIAALVLAAISLLLALGAHIRATRLREEIDYVRRTSRANADRSEEMLNALRAELTEKIKSARPAASSSAPSWFSPRMTIADALKVHPGVKAVLATLHIGGCSSCSVSETETLEQAATGHRVDLDEMLDKMNALMTADAKPAVVAAPVDPLVEASKALPPANGGRVMLAVGKLET